jgi:hypothetical protein
MAALVLAAISPGRNDYLLAAAVTVVAERRAAGAAPENVYLAAM